jgi:hypothetical protein
MTAQKTPRTAESTPSGPSRDREPGHARAAESSPLHARLLALHHTAGNGAVAALVRSRSRGAGVGLADSPLGRAYRTNHMSEAVALVSGGKAPGAPLPRFVADQAAKQVGGDFSRVRIHTDRFAEQAARDVGADAFTVGQDIFFRQGEFAPGTAAGQRLLQHELVHTRQHQAGQLGQPESALEAQAEHAPAQAGNRAQAAPAPAATRLLRRSLGHCTRIVIKLPHTIIFHGTTGPITGYVITNLPPSPRSRPYTAQLDAATEQLTITPWPTPDVVLDVSIDVRGTDRQMERQIAHYKAYLTSIPAAGVPLKVVGTPVENAGLRRGKGGSSTGTGTKPTGDAASGGAAGEADSESVAPGGPEGTAEGTAGGTGTTPGAAAGGADATGAQAGTAADTGTGGGTGAGAEADQEPGGGAAAAPLPPEVAEFYKDAATPKGEQIPAADLARMYDAYTRFIKGKPKWGEIGQSFQAWVDFLDKNARRLRGTIEAKEGGTLDQVVMERLMKKLKTGQPLEFPAAEEKTLTKKAKAARQQAGLAGLPNKPEWLLLSKQDRALLLDVAARYPDLFADAAGSDVHTVTFLMKRAMALQMAVRHIPGTIGEQLQAMAEDPWFWVGVASSIALYTGLWLAPEAVVSKVIAGGLTTILIVNYGLALSDLVDFAKAWMTFNDQCKAATSGAELEKAAKGFAGSLSAAGLQVLMALAFWAGGKAVGTARGRAGGKKAKAPAKESARGGPADESPTPGKKAPEDFSDLNDELADVPEGQGPVTGQRLGQKEPGTPPPESPAKKPRTPEEIAKDKATTERMEKLRTDNAVEKLADVPDLKQAVENSKVKMSDGKTALRDIAADNPTGLREMWNQWRAGREAGKIKTKDFGEYVKRRQSEFRGAAGEAGESFKRGPDEIMVKAPKTDVTEPGTDLITYDKKADRVKVIDNKAVQPDATVSKVSASEWNLPKNLADDIAQIEAYAKQPGVPPEIADTVLPRLHAAKADLDAYVAANPKKSLKSAEVQKEFGRILDKHKIDRVVTTSSGGPGATISGGLKDKGFKQE